MAILLALVILSIYLFRSTTPQQESSGLGRWRDILMLYFVIYVTFSFQLKTCTFSPCLCRSTSAFITVAAFLLGALCSGIAGYVGMWVSVRANVRVSSAARRSAREALQVFSSQVDKYMVNWKQLQISILIIDFYMQIAVRAGGFSAIVVVGMAVIGVAILYSTFYVWLGVDSPGSMKVTDCKSHLLLLNSLMKLAASTMFISVTIEEKCCNFPKGLEN